MVPRSKRGLSEEEQLIQAADAARCLEVMEPLLAKYEQDAFSEAVNADWELPDGESKAKRALERVKIIKELRGDLQRQTRPLRATANQPDS